MRTFLVRPYADKAVGGAFVLGDLAAALLRLGRPATLVAVGDAARIQTNGIPVVPLGEADPGPEDVWLIPEGFVTALAPGLKALARTVVYCQNAAFLFSAMPDGLDWRSLPVEFLAVSDPTARYIEATLGKSAPVLRPGIDPRRFYAPDEKPAPPIRVAWMPRKNKALGTQILDAAGEILRGKGLGQAVRFDPIERLSRDETATKLREAHIFLATGFPEGCPLPPLEAMTSGCLVLGFAGFGGFDYLRPPSPELIPAMHRPWFALRPVPWGDNALVVADADCFGAAMALVWAVEAFLGGDPKLGSLLAQSRLTAEHYSAAAFERTVDALWSEAEAGRLFTTRNRVR